MRFQSEINLLEFVLLSFGLLYILLGFGRGLGLFLSLVLFAWDNGVSCREFNNGVDQTVVVLFIGEFLAISTVFGV